MTILSVNQENAIDVANWIHDPNYFQYPEGARPKNAYFPPLELDLSYIKKDRRYLYKRSSHAPPDQFWAEIVAYKIACQLGVVVPPAFAAYNSQTGSSAALIEWFYVDETAMFIPGGDYMRRQIADFDDKLGKQHNLYHTEVVGRALSIALKDSFKTNHIMYWAEVFLFDSLIGNSDRHQNNWGVLYKIEGNNKVTAELSPLFDNGTSLGSGRFVKKLQQWVRK